MNVKEAKEKGFILSGYVAYQRGYISRKNFIADNETVHCGRKGLYYLAPCWTTSQYCIRVYLV